MRKGIFSAIADLIFPPRCVFCDVLTSDASYYCGSCATTANQDYCYICKKTKPKCMCRLAVDNILTPLIYTGNVRKKLIHLKANQDDKLVDILTDLMLTSYTNSIYSYKSAVVIPVPASRESLSQRGFNQAELLASAFSIKLGFPYYTGTITRSNDSLTQHSLNWSERMDNAEKSYKLAEYIDLSGINVILIDDISTTGATLHACAKALEECNPASIIAVCVASTTASPKG